MVTRVAFLMTDTEMKTLEEGIGYQFQGRCLVDLCAKHDRAAVILRPTCRLEEDQQNILESRAEQAFIWLQKAEGVPYGIELAHCLVDTGIDVALLAYSHVAGWGYNLDQLTAGFQTTGVTDLNVLARGVDQFLQAGNRFHGQNPYNELIKRQNEAHQVCIATLEACQRRFEHLQRLAHLRRR